MTLGGYAADSLPFLGAWWALALAGRGFLVTWVLGVTAGVLVRALVLGHHGWNQLSFLVVALVFVGAVAFVAYRVLEKLLER